MSIKKFVFCDICNPQGIRLIEYRRAQREGERSGRRISDNRAWYEGELEDALVDGQWLCTEDGLHICPACQKLHVN